MSGTAGGESKPPRSRRTVREHGPDPVDVHVGRRLRQARLLSGLSQEELGDGIGVSFQAVQKYEQGENSPERLRRLFPGGEAAQSGRRILLRRPRR